MIKINELQQIINNPFSEVIIDGEDQIIILWNDEVHYCEVITTSILSAGTVENTNYFDHSLGVLVVKDHDSGDKASLEAAEWHGRLEYPEYLDCQLCGEIKISFELGDSMASAWQLMPDDDMRPHRFCREVCLDLVNNWHCYGCNIMFCPYETKWITIHLSNFDDTHPVCTNCNNRLSEFDLKRYKEEKIAKMQEDSLSNHEETIWPTDEGEEF